MQMHGLTLDERIDSENTRNNAVTSGCEYEAIKDPLHEDNSQDVIINITSNALSIPTVLPVSLDDLGEFVLNCHKNENDIFIDQFQVSDRQYYLPILHYLLSFVYNSHFMMEIIRSVILV